MGNETKVKLEDEINKKIKTFRYYQKQAVDFSKRNRLLKYPAKASSIEFDISLSECQIYFGPIVELKIILPHKEILEYDLDNVKSEEINSLPKTNLNGKNLITQLDKLRLQAKTNYDSHGLHTLFLAIGELKWKEGLAGRGSSDAISEYDYAAPFLLIPVEIKPQVAPHKSSIIELNSELYDIQVNPVLKLFIQQELELSIPKSPNDFTNFKWEDTHKLLTKYEKILKDTNLDCTITTKIRLGQFTFHGQQIYEDLKRNETKMLANEFISSMCGDGQIIQQVNSLSLEDEYNVDNFLTEGEDFTILDADESQIKSIKAVLGGKHLVIHGPPGTGKSQTIANLIANLLARDKKILFVCEKQVALDVVYNRLKTKDADISDLCLPLFNYTTDKKQFAKSIIESRDRVLSSFKKTKINKISDKLVERTEKIYALKRYANSLLLNRKPLNKTVYWMHGELARVLPQCAGIVFMWDKKNPEEIDFISYKDISNILNDLTEYSDLLFNKENYWNKLEQTNYTPDYSSLLLKKLKELKRIVELIPNLNETFFWNYNCLNDIYEIIKFAKNNEVKELLNTNLISADIFNTTNLYSELEYSESIKIVLNNYDEDSGETNKYKIPDSWDPIEFKYSLFDKNYELSKLNFIKKDISFLEDKIVFVDNAISINKYSKELLKLTGSTINRFRIFFNVDPIVQKIRYWYERTSLYEVHNSLNNINNIYFQLVNAQNILDEWAISFEEIDPKEAWNIENNFSTKYKTFLRVIFPSFRKDKNSIHKWCSAHRPQHYKEFKKIILAISDRLRLSIKYDKAINDFIEKYTIDLSSKNISFSMLSKSISKLISYFELAGIDKLNEEIKTLISESNTDTIKQIFTFYEDIISQKDILNNFINRNEFNENVYLIDFINNSKEVLKEFHTILALNDKSNIFLNVKSNTLEEMCLDIETLNKLKKHLDIIRSYNPIKYLKKENITEIIGTQNEINKKQNQIKLVLQTLNGVSYSRIDYYSNLKILCDKIKNVEDWYSEYTSLKKDIEKLMNNDNALDYINQLEISSLETYLNNMIDDKVGLDRWINYQKIKFQLVKYGMSWFISDIIEQEIQNIKFDFIFQMSFISKLLSNIYQNDVTLKEFNVKNYQRYINDFIILEKDIFEANKFRILGQAYQRIKLAMEHGGNSERTILRESQKIKRHIPIRKLVMENSSHIINYKPCWMMSPLTLSSYIPFGTIKFDVVIFDEASQMKIENAIGPISRASQTVVIGDEHQLPPTPFFAAASDDDEDDDLEEVGYESILQIAIAILPGAKSELLYHYRSKSEDLIAFSNYHIYGNRLITFSSSFYNKNAVQFEFVENGIYDAGQSNSNKIEAKRVAELCIAHVSSSNLSLGVIAFSKSQEEAIREAIKEKIKDFPQFSDKLDETSNINEEFFIKNLESSQGDERDTIILSIGYGPDKNDNVFNRFGPINSKNGYRRLNVAITRAKDKIICVSSMKFHRMNPNTESRGAVLLQKYLEYAEKGREVLEASKIINPNNREADSEFELSVQSALEEKGFIIHRQIGAAGYSIDLAILSPKNHNEYILGIECDGAAYHSSKSARTRDRLRQQILERLGWKIYRVWSQHWINNRNEIINDIISIVNS